MGDYKIELYEGANYGLEPKFSSDSGSLSPFIGYRLPASSFGMTTDPRTANQLKAVSDKLSTGAKTVEITGIDTNVLEYTPKQHFKEINRLKQLAGVDLTFHGPLVEPTGITRGNWDEQQRKQAERQMWSALERAHDLEDKGNIVVAFHSSNGLPEVETTIKDEETGKPRVTAIGVINEQTGEFGQLPRSGRDYWVGEEKYDPEKDLERMNKRVWTQQLSGLNIEAERSRQSVQQALKLVRSGATDPKEAEASEKALMEAYNIASTDPQYYEKFIAAQGENRKMYDVLITELSYGKGHIQDTYIGLQRAFNQAYEAAERDKLSQDAETRKEAENAIQELENFKKEVTPLTTKYEHDPKELVKFTEAVTKGVRLLGSLNEPRVWRPLKEFAVDKASETFGNLAFKSYKEFAHDKPENTAPIISIENPPVGMGLTRANELKDLVERSREKFVQNATASEKDGGLGLSKATAEREAEKLIGVTWDVGHINMLKKYGFKDEDITKQTETIAQFVKHVHLSDNFGLEHTELPMGMGNVPIKKHEKILSKEFGEKFKKIKQIVETGGWYQHFKTSPLAETFEAFGSPIYPMKMASHWNAGRGTGRGYFGGYGRMLPDVNFSTYGAGFSQLPSELGGQIGGRSRLSGTPNE